MGAHWCRAGEGWTSVPLGFCRLSERSAHSGAGTMVCNFAGSILIWICKMFHDPKKKLFATENLVNIQGMF